MNIRADAVVMWQEVCRVSHLVRKCTSQLLPLSTHHFLWPCQVQCWRQGQDLQFSMLCFKMEHISLTGESSLLHFSWLRVAEELLWPYQVTSYMKYNVKNTPNYNPLCTKLILGLAMLL